MRSWLDAFEAAMARNDPNNRVQVATVSPEGTPAIRTVILRGVTGQGALFFVTDLRSQKAEHLAENHRISVLAWYAHTREQFRFTGKAEVHNGYATGQWAMTRAQLWTGLNEADRAAFLGPPPGRGFVAPHHVELPEAPPAEFCVVSVEVTEVDWLTVGPPHRRVHFRLMGNAWVEELLVP
ncbi:MAG: pyridoxamine 5'-phosphate oxidase family protein [Myxococcales bacterium]|nr:pyridoxamine 5'-phosphate oxidase family protein [Myxococcales bacterium]